MLEKVYLVLAKSVAYEIVEDEVVIIHLEKGHYYSLKGSAVDIWSNIARGLTEQAIVDDVLMKYEGDQKKNSDAIRQFISELKQEELIAPALDGEAERPDATASLPDSHKRPSFSPPTMEKYTDLEELLLLDPVHEVDDTGWPHQQED